MKNEGISVIVCCYNSTSRIEPTLQHILQQETDGSFNWEIIVIDNNSTDGTAQFAKKLLAEAETPVSNRVVFEPKPGLSNARNKGFEEATYNIVLMVDDDNSLCSDYLQGIWNAFKKNASAGMVGGLGIAALEATAPAWFWEYDYCYAIGPQSNNGKAIEHLYGAGLALRMDVMEKIRGAGFTGLLSDRIGKTLMSGGDTELCYAFRMAGYELVFNPEIFFMHHLPKGRVNWRYLRRLFYGFGQTKAYLDIYTSCLAGREMPENGRLPFWFNRAVYLANNAKSDLTILLLGAFFNLEGNDRLLKALARLGQVKRIVQLNTAYISLFSKIHLLKKHLNKG
ncbi:MAG: glycosyltransferase [Flavobacteriales bacterium]|nr:glycosyltransferase [Flavobacteriales bacterium]